jgi:hypothetical protein
MLARFCMSHTQKKYIFLKFFFASLIYIYIGARLVTFVFPVRLEVTHAASLVSRVLHRTLGHKGSV